MPAGQESFLQWRKSKSTLLLSTTQGCAARLLGEKEDPTSPHAWQELPQPRHRLVSNSKVLISRCLGKAHSSKGEPEWDMPTGLNRSFGTDFKTKIISATKR